MNEKGLTKLVHSSHFSPTPVGAGFGTWSLNLHFNRLPWRQRASPSATRHESVVSTDANIMISLDKMSKTFLGAGFI